MCHIQVDISLTPYHFDSENYNLKKMKLEKYMIRLFQVTIY